MSILILRGLPGSGKSTYANGLANQLIGEPSISIYSADDYHTIDGVYKYNPAKAGNAHAWCLGSYLDRVKQLKSLGVKSDDKTVHIIVDNTNTQAWEISPYIQLAYVYGVVARILYFPCSIENAVRRNIHGVPHGTILMMNRALLTEVLPGHWPVEIAVNP